MSASAGPKSRTSIVPRSGRSEWCRRRQVGRRRGDRRGVACACVVESVAARESCRCSVELAQTVSTFRTVTVSEPFGASYEIVSPCGCPVECRSERRRRADHVGVLDDFLHVADEVPLGHVVGIALVDDGVHLRGLDDLGVLEQVLELADATLHVPLLVLGGVVAGVLLEVALFAGDFDLVGDLDAATRRQIVEFRLELVVGGLRELRVGHGPKDTEWLARPARSRTCQESYDRADERRDGRRIRRPDSRRARRVARPCRRAHRAGTRPSVDRLVAPTDRPQMDRRRRRRDGRRD